MILVKTNFTCILYTEHQSQVSAPGSVALLFVFLGREQAALTGQRLADMNYPYTKLISSTMTRAKETADIIHKYLPELPREETDMLREGAPIPPEPASGAWRPEAHVRQVIYAYGNFISKRNIQTSPNPN